MKTLKYTAIVVLLLSGHVFAGTCPAGANYISLSAPTTNGFIGSVTLGSGSATNSAITSCVYSDPVAGSDANTGADEAHPFQFVKGMPNCASNCAAVTTLATTAWIVKGGGTYHRSSGTPLMGGVWAVPAFGYVGIDPAWFTGGSFTRPIINMDNPLNTSLVASCSFDDGASTNINGASLAAAVVFDGFEFTGACSSTTGANGGAYIVSGTSDFVERQYLHGWTETTGSLDDRFFPVEGSGGGTNRYLYLIIDGQDSSLGTQCTISSCVAACWNGSTTPSPGCATGWAMDDCGDVEYSAIRHASQGCEAGNILIWHDNLTEYIFEPIFGGRHGNVLEALSMNSTATFRYYNNVDRNVNEGENINGGGTTQYFFNNLCENDQHFPADPNSFLIEPFSNNSSGVIAVSFVGNTVDNTCAASGLANTWALGSTIAFANNHIIARTTLGGFFGCGTGNNCATTDNGGELFQTLAVANSQGYTLTNDFAPTLITNGTVGAGTNQAASCATFSVDSALCFGTSQGVTEVSGWGGLIVSYPAITVNARPTAWDAGAYQFSAAVVPPAPAPWLAEALIP